MIISGVKTLNLIIYTTKKYAELLQKTGFNVEKIKFVIMNRVICFNTHYEINLEELSKGMDLLDSGIVSVKYEPRSFPG